MAGPDGVVHGWHLMAGAVPRQSIPSNFATRLVPVGEVAVAAVVMLLLTTGFRVGVGDNIHHLSLAFDHASLPQFARDRFLQDPHGVLVRPLERWLVAAANLPALCLAASVLTVFGYCFALLRIVARLAAVDMAGLAAGAALIGMTYLDSGYTLLSCETIAGGAFTASIVAVALVASSLASALYGSLGVAVALLGVAFDMESAVALWGVAGIAGASLALASDGVPIARGWLVGGVCALVLAAPAEVWWVREVAASGSFSGVTAAGLGMAELNQVPAWLLPLERWVLFGCTLVLGLSAFSVLGSDARVARGAFAGFLAVFALGCVLPLLTDSPWVPILRPMAADAFLQLIASAAAVAVVLRDLRSGGGVLRMALSVAIAASLLLHRDLLPLAALAMLARAAAAHGEMIGLERRIRDYDRAILCRVALAMVVLAGVGGWVVRSGVQLW